MARDRVARRSVNLENLALVPLVDRIFDVDNVADLEGCPVPLGRTHVERPTPVLMGNEGG